MKPELKYAALVKHGHNRQNKHSLTYSSWAHMLSRCRDRNNDNFRNYGGAGIKVCKRWLVFKNFLADMGMRPVGTSLDRFPNNAGDYKPSNCRWASPKTQTRNQARRLKITVNGVTRLACEWSESLGLRPGEVVRRISRGWDPVRAATTKNKAPKKKVWNKEAA